MGRFKIKNCEYDYGNMLTIVFPNYTTVTHGKDSLPYITNESNIKHGNGEDCSCRDCAC